MPLPQDVVELVQHAARHPDGAGPLFEGDLESVAALYQVHPERVEHARRTLEAPQARLHATRLISDGAVGVEPPHRPARKGVDEVLAEALALPHGLELLTEAPLEMAAVLLAAHPFIVEEARARLAFLPFLPRCTGDLAS